MLFNLKILKKLAFFIVTVKLIESNVIIENIDPKTVSICYLIPKIIELNT